MANVLDLVKDVGGQEDGLPAPGRLPYQRLEPGLHERVQAGRRLVQQQHVRPGHQRRDQRELLPVALGVGAGPLSRVEPQPLDEFVPERHVHMAVQVPKIRQRLHTGQLRPYRYVPGDVAGDVADVPVGALDAQVEAVHRDHPSETLGQTLGPYRRRDHRAPPHDPVPEAGDVIGIRQRPMVPSPSALRHRSVHHLDLDPEPVVFCPGCHRDVRLWQHRGRRRSLVSPAGSTGRIVMGLSAISRRASAQLTMLPGHGTAVARVAAVELDIADRRPLRDRTGPSDRRVRPGLLRCPETGGDPSADELPRRRGAHGTGG